MLPWVSCSCMYIRGAQIKLTSEEWLLENMMKSDHVCKPPCTLTNCTELLDALMNAQSAS